MNKPPDRTGPAVVANPTTRASSPNLLLEPEEAFGCSGTDGVGDTEFATAVEEVGGQNCPIGQRRGDIGGREHIVGAIGGPTGAAEDQVATRHRELVNDRSA